MTPSTRRVVSIANQTTRALRLRTAQGARTSSIVRVQALHTSRQYREESASDKVKSAAKTVDRTVSDAAIKGIDKGEAAASSLKQAAGAGQEKAKQAAASGTEQAKDATAIGQQKAKEAAAAGENHAQATKETLKDQAATGAQKAQEAADKAKAKAESL